MHRDMSLCYLFRPKPYIANILQISEDPNMSGNSCVMKDKVFKH